MLALQPGLGACQRSKDAICPRVRPKINEPRSAEGPAPGASRACCKTSEGGVPRAACGRGNQHPKSAFHGSWLLSGKAGGPPVRAVHPLRNDPELPSRSATLTLTLQGKPGSQGGLGLSRCGWLCRAQPQGQEGWPPPPHPSTMAREPRDAQGVWELAQESPAS